LPLSDLFPNDVGFVRVRELLVNETETVAGLSRSGLLGPAGTDLFVGQRRRARLVLRYLLRNSDQFFRRVEKGMFVTARERTDDRKRKKIRMPHPRFTRRIENSPSVLVGEKIVPISRCKASKAGVRNRYGIDRRSIGQR